MLAWLIAISLSVSQQQALYKSLDPESIDAHIAYGELFKETPEGKKALLQAWKMMGAAYPLGKTPPFSAEILQNLTSLKPATLFDDATLMCIETLAHKLPNRLLKGHYATTLEEILELDPKDIEISRALLIDDPLKRRSFEASLDLLALKVLARLQKEGGLDAAPEKKIAAMNQLLFFDIALRYPPLALSEEHIDSYSDLSSVLESGRGVCLGTSFVYLAVAERINLPLEIVTPPGHIYVRSKDHAGRRVNVETTARGVDVSDCHYQSINVRFLKTRNRKEAIGLLFSNEASVHIRERHFDKALACYEKTALFAAKDPLFTQLRGICLALTGRTEEAQAVLKEALILQEETQIDQLTLAADYVQGRVDAEGLRTFFLETAPSEEGLLKKVMQLEPVLQRYPYFREGLVELADIYLKLQRPKEAIAALERYHAQDPGRLQVEFMLGILSMERGDYAKAHHHLLLAKELLAKHAHKSRDFDAAWRALCSCYTPPV